jgi:hypothetical protein
MLRPNCKHQWSVYRSIRVLYHLGIYTHLMLATDPKIVQNILFSSSISCCSLLVARSMNQTSGTSHNSAADDGTHNQSNHSHVYDNNHEFFSEGLQKHAHRNQPPRNGSRSPKGHVSRGGAEGQLGNGTGSSSGENGKQLRTEGNSIGGASTFTVRPTWDDGCVFRPVCPMEELMLRVPNVYNGGVGGLLYITNYRVLWMATQASALAASEDQLVSCNVRLEARACETCCC